MARSNPRGYPLSGDDFEATDGLFRCDDESVVQLEGDYGQGVTLEDVGKSIDELE